MTWAWLPEDWRRVTRVIDLMNLVGFPPAIARASTPTSRRLSSKRFDTICDECYSRSMSLSDQS